MARARNIKPSFFMNEDLVELPLQDRLLFIGLWTLADREGRLEDRPKRIKMEVFPADDIDVSASLDRLAETGMILRYQVGDGRFIEVVNFTKHQRPHVKEAASTIPAPGEAQPAPTKDGASTDLGEGEHALIPDTGYLNEDTGYRNADCGSTASADAQAQAPAKPKAKRATQVPADFDVTDALIAWGKTPKADFSEAEMREQVPKFVAWYQANGRPMKDWHATFQSWMYKSREFGQTFAKPRPAQRQSADKITSVEELFAQGDDDDGQTRNPEDFRDSATSMAGDWPRQGGDSGMDVSPGRNGFRVIASRSG